MLQKMTQHRWDKIKAASKQLGSPDEVKITSANRTTCRSWLNGLGIPSHLYDCATLEELQEAYYSCSTNYVGLQRIIEAEQGIEGDKLKYWTRQAADRAYAAMPYNGIMNDPAIILALPNGQEAAPLPVQPTQPNQEGTKPMTPEDNTAKE